MVAHCHNRWPVCTIIYFYLDERMPLFLILVYAKVRKGDMTPDEKKKGSSRQR
jgi:hypothetical protein